MAQVITRGPYATVVLLDDVILTGSFIDNQSDVIDLSPFNQVEIFVDYSSAGATAALLKVELQEELDAPFKELSIASDAAPVGGVVLSTIYPRRLRIEQGAGAQRRWFAFPSGARALQISAAEEGGIDGTITVGLKLSGVQKVD